jgi:hypothetical protein
MSDTSQNLATSTDLLAGLDLGSNDVSSQVPILASGNTGMLHFSQPLIGASGNQVMSVAPLHPQTTNSGLFFDMGQQMNFSKPTTNNNNFDDGSNIDNSNKSASASKKPTTWDTVAGVNIDLVSRKFFKFVHNFLQCKLSSFTFLRTILNLGANLKRNHHCR